MFRDCIVVLFFVATKKNLKSETETKTTKTKIAKKGKDGKIKKTEHDFHSRRPAPATHTRQTISPTPKFQHKVPLRFHIQLLLHYI
jgi:hypothetical protein